MPSLFRRTGPARLITVVALAAALSGAGSAHAATAIWNADSGSWPTAANWVGVAIPSGTDVALFGFNDQIYNSTITLDGNQTIAGLTFGDANTLSGVSWTLASGTPASSSLTLSGTVNVNLPAFPAFSTGQAATISAPLSGTAGFTKLGTGLLILSGSSTISGTVVLGSSTANSGYQGGIRVTNNNALGTATVRQPAGGNNTLEVLELANGVTISNTVQIGGKDGGLPGIRNVSGANTYTGTAYQVSTGGGTTLEAAGGTFTFAGLLTGTTVTTRVLNLSGAAVGTMSGVISGSFNQLNRIGVGTWTLSGTSTLSGAVQLLNGTTVLDGSTGSFGTFGNNVTFGGTLTGYAGSGATLSYLGKSTGSILNTGTITLSVGDNTVSSTYGTSGTSGITASVLAARAAGATGNFVTSGGSNGTTNKIVLTTGSGNLLNPGIFFNGSNFAAYDSAGFIRGISYGTDAGSVTSSGGTTVSGTYVQITGNVTAQTTSTLTTLNLSGSPNLTLASGQTLTVSGILKSGGSGTSTISGGAGIQPTNAGELVLRADAAGDALILATPIPANGIDSVTKSGAGTVTLSASGTSTFAGPLRINGGTLVMAGVMTGTNTTTVLPGGKLVVTGTMNPSAVANTGTLIVGSAAGNAVMEINGGTVNTGAVAATVGTAAGANGSLVVNSGAFNVVSSSQKDLTMGTGGQIGTPAFGALTVNGGSVSVGGYLVAGISTNGVGVVNIRGGSVSTNGAYGGTLGATAPSATANSLGVMNVTGGTFASTNATFSALLVGENATGILNVSGSGAVNLGGAVGNTGLKLAASNTAAYGIANLGGVGTGGGTISTNIVSKGTGTGIFNFHGGTLEARAALANTGTFMTGLTAAYVYGEGGTINTNSQDITIGQALLAPTGSGVSSIAVSGGTGYINTPIVTLVGGGGVGATAVATIDSSGNLTGITVTNPGTGYTSAPVATLTGGGGTGAVVGAITIAANSSGGLTKTGAGTLSLTGASTYTGTTAVNAGTLTFTNTLASNVTVASGATIAATGTTTGSLALASGATFTANTAGTYVTANGVSIAPSTNLVISGSVTSGVPYTLFKYGAGGVSGTGNFVSPFRVVLADDAVNQLIKGTATTLSLTWGGTSNTWDNAGAADWSGGNQFYAGDTVAFGTAAAANTVTVSGTVLPTAMSVNSSTDYLFTGSGNIGGSTSLVKDGSGVLTLATANSYSGGTTLNAGTLNVNNAAALGSGTVTIAGGGLGNTSGAAVALSSAVSQTWSGDFSYSGPDSLNMGNGRVTLGGSGTRTVTVSSGTLTVGGITGTSVSGTLGFTKAGAGTLTLNPTAIAGAVGSAVGDLTVSDGTLNMGAFDLTTSGLAGSGTIANGSNTTRWLFAAIASGTKTFDGSLQDGGGTGKLGLNVSGGGTQVINGNGSWSDTTTVNGATTKLILNGVNSGTSYTDLQNGPTLQFGNTAAIAAGSRVNLNGAQTATVIYATDGGDNAYAFGGNSNSTLNIVLDRATAGTNVTHPMSTAGVGVAGFGGGTFTVNFTRGASVSGTATASFDQFNLGGGSGGSTTANPAVGTVVTIGSVTKSLNAAAQTLGLGGVTTGNAVTGIISNGVGTVSVVKSNTSSWTLSGNSTYTGTTAVLGGTLYVHGNNSAATGAVSVAGGALGGNGQLGGAITVGTGGTIIPGASIGTLTGAQGVSFTDGSTFGYELNSALVTADLLRVGSDLTLTGTVTLTLTDLATSTLMPADTVLSLVNYGNAWNGGLLTFGGTALADEDLFTFGVNQFRIDYNSETPGVNVSSPIGTNYVNLVVVPEPTGAVAALTTLCLAGLVWRRRRD